MYDSAIVTVALVRMGLAFAFLYLALPKLLFRQERGISPLDAFFANMVRMVLLLQVASYPLAAARLYEVISLAIVFLAVGLWRIRSSRTPEEISKWRSHLMVRGLDLADRRIDASYLMGRCKSIVASQFGGLMAAMRDRLNLVDSLMLAAVLAYAIYLRFLDAVTSAAPAMSDSYVTLAWMKYIERRQLFHDGVYPHGFHIYLSVLRKFSAVDALFALKYAGPLNSVLTTLSCYYFVSRMTGNALAGVSSAFAYGCLPSFMPYEFQRQAATNSQEFAMLFLLPAILYFARHLDRGSASDLCAAFCALAAIGLTHPVVTLFAVAGACAAVCGSVFALSTGFRRLARMAGAGLGAGLVSGIPLAAGVLAGIPFHGSSAEFAVAEGAATVPVIASIHAVALGAGLAACLVQAVMARSRHSRSRLLTCGFFVCLSVLIYMAPALGINNLALSGRSGEVYALAVCVALGLAVAGIAPHGSLGRRWFSVAWGWTTRAGLACLVAVTLALFPQSPARPYKMQTDESAGQYIRILLTDTPTDWLVVSDFEGYSLVLGRGWHLMTGDFVSQVDPSDERLVVVREGVASPLNMSKIYLFYEENPYKPPIDEALPQYARKVEDLRRLAEWMTEYEAHHGPLKVYHQGPELTIYVIERPPDKRKEFERIWSEG